jgi:chromosome partitioning protein
MRRIAVANLKGGVSKSTTAACLAVELARRKHRVLAIDLDGQANLTWTLFVGKGAAPPTIGAVLMRQASVEDAIRPTGTRGLDLLPADAALGGVNIALAQELGRDTRLRSALAAVEDRYDFAVIDTGPTLTTLLVNGLVAASEVLVPTDPAVFAVLGLVELQNIVAEVAEAYANPGLHITGLVLAKVPRNNVARDVEAQLRERFGTLVMQATIPLAAAVEEAHSRGLTVLDHAPRSPAAAAYRALTEEVLAHGRTQEGGRLATVRRAGTGDAA